MLGHIGDQLVEHAALPKQGVAAGLAGIGLEQAVHPEALVDRPQEGQQRGCERADQQQAIAPHGFANAAGTEVWCGFDS